MSMYAGEIMQLDLSHRSQIPEWQERMVRDRRYGYETHRDGTPLKLVRREDI